MSNQNAWNDVERYVIKKNVGAEYISSWKSYLTFILLFISFSSIFIVAMPEYFLKVSKPIEMSGRDEVVFFRIAFLIGYLLIYGCTYGKMKFTGETEQFWHYTIVYFFAMLMFALGLIFYYESGWWVWLSFIFFGFGIFCFLIAAGFWSEHKKLVYQFNWEDLGNGQKFLIIQNGQDVMLYELKDKVRDSEILQDNKIDSSLLYMSSFSRIFSIAKQKWEKHIQNSKK